MKKGDIVDGAFNTRDQAGLVVELDTGRTHVMPDARAPDTGREVVAELALVGAGELAPEEGGDMLGLDDVHGGAHDGFVEGLELGLAAKDHVGGLLRLYEAPVVARAEVTQHRAEALCPKGEMLMEHRCAECVGEFLRLGRIGNKGEGVVEHLEGNTGLPQLAGQPGVTVEVDLQPERCPGRHAHVAHAELRIDEVEVVMQAVAGSGLEEGVMGRLVVPPAIGRARLHRREDMHQG